MTQAHRWFLKWARTLHVYLTLFGLALLLFFALTGFMLNHEDWFSSPEPIRQTIEGKMPSAFLGEPTNQLGIVEKLRKDFGARGEVDIFEDDKDNDAIRVNFKSPGYFAEATIKREDGATEVRHEARGVVGVVLDLHRGKTSGLAWSCAIDGVSILFVIVSITGLILWSSLRGRAQHGLAVLMIGLALSLAVYFVWVPR
jgi:hypothetical protein